MPKTKNFFALTFFQGTRTKYLTRFFIVYLLMQIGVRTALLLHSQDVVSFHILDILRTFSFGLLYDATFALQALLPLFLLLLIVPSSLLNQQTASASDKNFAAFTGRAASKFVKVLLKVATFIIYFFMLFIAISEYLFWEEFQTNFNFIAVDYLIYTTEVLANINQAYNLWLLIPLLLALTLLLTFSHFQLLHGHFQPIKLSNKVAGLACALLLPLILFQIVDSKWRNYVSDNKYNVEIAGNGPYEFVSAFRNNELDYPSFYLTQDNNEVLGHLRVLLATQNSSFLDEHSVTRHIRTTGPERKPNIVMIVVESLSADYMARFGNRDNLTPQLDKLAQESLFFTNVYATGTRTVRGIEALSMSVPPTPGQSIVRRPENDDLFLLGTVLKEKGYTNDFIYGGYGYFDNMNAFFADNAFSVIDRTDIEDSKIFFETAWGVADEIIFNQALEDIDTKTKQNKKVFQFVLTTSNHSPFTYPDNRIDIPVGTREGAVKYTDWAIGDFMAKAKNKDWFKDTIFIIVADHQANSAGKVDLPVNKYHIPCLIYAPGLIAAGENNRLMSQIDIAPTLLGMLGFSYDSRFLGYDINTLEPGRERAFISTYQNLGYIKDDKLVILRPQNKVDTYKINDFAKSDYTLLEKDDKLTEEAVAWYQGASYLYKNKLLKNNKY